MSKTTLVMDDYLYDFYKKIADYTEVKTAEEVMVDALQNIAVELTEAMDISRGAMMA